MAAIKTRAGGRWTDGQFNSFIKSGLRRMSMRWSPKSDCKKNARLPKKYRNGKGRLVFNSTCAICNVRFAESLGAVDHIEPVVPVTGFTNWDDVIQRLFCEADGLQVVCPACHKTKTEEEKNERKRIKQLL